eukprot:1341123-Amphidinium_carterae.1
MSRVQDNRACTHEGQSKEPLLGRLMEPSPCHGPATTCVETWLSCRGGHDVEKCDAGSCEEPKRQVQLHRLLQDRPDGLEIRVEQSLQYLYHSLFCIARIEGLLKRPPHVL